MESLFGWFGSLMEWFGDLIPRVKIAFAHTHYVTWTRGGAPRLRETSFIYWPFWTNVWSNTRLQVVESLSSQTLTTKDLNAVMVDAVLAYHITDPLLYWQTFEPGEAIDETAGAAVREVVFGLPVADLFRRRDDLEDALTEEAQHTLERFGIRVEYLHLTSLAQTRVLSLVGDAVNVTVGG